MGAVCEATAQCREAGALDVQKLGHQERMRTKPGTRVSTQPSSQVVEGGLAVGLIHGTEAEAVADVMNCAIGSAPDLLDRCSRFVVGVEFTDHPDDGLRPFLQCQVDIAGSTMS